MAGKVLQRDQRKDAVAYRETGASIVLIKFDAGIPQPHYHSSNQFMFCLSGRYEYTPTNVVLMAGSFCCSPKGNVHGPAVGREGAVVLEIYDGPHYPEKAILVHGCARRVLIAGHE